MTEELISVKRYIESTGRAETLLERENFILVKWDNPYNPGIRYCLHAFPYGKSGMANNEPWRYDITDEQAADFLAHPDKAEEFFNSKHWFFHTCDAREVSFDEIAEVKERGISFKDMHWFDFAECVYMYRRDFPSSRNCVGERDITAKPPYIEFWSFYHHDKVVFDRRGAFSKNKNTDNFHKLFELIEKYGYSTRDLS